MFPPKSFYATPCFCGGKLDAEDAETTEAPSSVPLSETPRRERERPGHTLKVFFEWILKWYPRNQRGGIISTYFILFISDLWLAIYDWLRCWLSSCICGNPLCWSFVHLLLLHELIIWLDTLEYHIISYHIISYHIISYHIISWMFHTFFIVFYIDWNSILQPLVLLWPQFPNVGTVKLCQVAAETAEAAAVEPAPETAVCDNQAAAMAFWKLNKYNWWLVMDNYWIFSSLVWLLGVSPGVIKMPPILGGETNNAACFSGKFEGFHWRIVHCLGWCHILTPDIANWFMGHVQHTDWFLRLKWLMAARWRAAEGPDQRGLQHWMTRTTRAFSWQRIESTGSPFALQF